MQILLIEDNPGDVRLTQEALKEGKVFHQLEVVADGESALDYLQALPPYGSHKRPDLILLDLNLPRKDGREVLREIKSTPEWRSIPVIVLTTSEAEDDLKKCYDLHANCYIVKPVDINHFIEVIQGIENFWFKIAKLPSSKV
jgi:chemotaxis family two-component system response regulator Rcp1